MYCTYCNKEFTHSPFYAHNDTELWCCSVQCYKAYEAKYPNTIIVKNAIKEKEMETYSIDKAKYVFTEMLSEEYSSLYWECIYDDVLTREDYHKIRCLERESAKAFCVGNDNESLQRRRQIFQLLWDKDKNFLCDFMTRKGYEVRANLFVLIKHSRKGWLTIIPEEAWRTEVGENTKSWEYVADGEKDEMLEELLGRMKGDY